MFFCAKGLTKPIVIFNERGINLKKIAVLFISIVMLLVFTVFAFAAEVMVTTGAGYKKMVEELSEAYQQEGGKITGIYGGHIGQMLMQIKQGSGVSIVISDRGTLEESSQGVEFEVFEDLGGTPLVLAWRKGLELTKPEDLLLPAVESVCYPDSKAAIYGRAAVSFLGSTGIGDKVKGKLFEVSSVPQVMAYLVSGEMDAGFVNRVMIVNGGGKLGGSMELHEGYPPLDMVAAVVKGHGDNTGVRDFLQFLRSDSGRAVLKKNGIWK